MPDTLQNFGAVRDDICDRSGTGPGCRGACIFCDSLIVSELLVSLRDIASFATDSINHKSAALKGTYSGCHNLRADICSQGTAIEAWC